MCGIVGYIGKRNSLPVLIDGLKRLEYRGYDSAGIAFQNGKGIEIYKTKGKIKDLETILPSPLIAPNTGLGHTRWATHGAPSSRNAHPHSTEGVVVVHNGIIENYQELKNELCAAGRRFLSDTDTEVIPHLIAHYVQSGLFPQQAIRKAVGRLRGMFAIGIMCDASPGALFAVRRGSPLVIGLGTDEYFFASDIPAVLPYTKRFILMDNGQLATLSPKDLVLESIDNAVVLPVDDKIIEVDWTPSMAEKKGYTHFMLKEIHEQPQTIMNMLASGLDAGMQLPSDLGLPEELLRSFKRLQIVACGTSYHAGLIGSYLIEHFAQVPVAVETASEYRYKKPLADHDTLFISITQSGETADTLAAQREAKRLGAKTLTICNVLGSTAAREATHVIYTKAGPEIGVASTKAFTSQLTALYLLALKLGLSRAALDPEHVRGLTSGLLSIPNAIAGLLKESTSIETLAQTLTGAKGFLYLGRGINFPVALEGALKLKEISYIFAEGYPAGEMKHGPIALIEEGVPVVVIAPTGELHEKVLSNIEEVRARGGRVLAITDSPASLGGKVNEVIEIPAIHPALTPFITVVPLQLLAYYIAVLKGCDVDQPRNLAKSVTVE